MASKRRCLRLAIDIIRVGRSTRSTCQEFSFFFLPLPVVTNLNSPTVFSFAELAIIVMTVAFIVMAIPLHGRARVLSGSVRTVRLVKNEARFGHDLEPVRHGSGAVCQDRSCGSISRR